MMVTWCVFNENEKTEEKSYSLLKSYLHMYTKNINGIHFVKLPLEILKDSHVWDGGFEDV